MHARSAALPARTASEGTNNFPILLVFLLSVSVLRREDPQDDLIKFISATNGDDPSTIVLSYGVGDIPSPTLHAGVYKSNCIDSYNAFTLAGFDPSLTGYFISKSDIDTPAEYAFTLDIRELDDEMRRYDPPKDQIEVFVRVELQKDGLIHQTLYQKLVLSTTLQDSFKVDVQAIDVSATTTAIAKDVVPDVRSCNEEGKDINDSIVGPNEMFCICFHKRQNTEVKSITASMRKDTTTIPVYDNTSGDKAEGVVFQVTFEGIMNLGISNPVRKLSSGTTHRELKSTEVVPFSFAIHARVPRVQCLSNAVAGGTAVGILSLGVGAYVFTTLTQSPKVAVDEEPDLKTLESGTAASSNIM